MIVMMKMAETEFEIISPSRLQSVNINWLLCFICQTNNGENLVNPTEKKGFDPEKNSYRTISENLKAFQEIDALPTLLALRCEKYETSEKLFDSLLEQKAVFHKSCMSSYNKQKLARKRKFVESSGTVLNEEEASMVSEVSDGAAKRRSTRKSEEKAFNLEKCFFCGGFSKDMHRCQTLELNQKVRDIATEMGDNLVISKLSQGDMVASDAKYHLRCLVEYKNKYRSFKSPGKVIKESSLIEGIALSEVSNTIEEFIISSETTPVFYMKDLRAMYQEKLKELGASNEQIERVNVTRLKEHILKEVHGLREEKNGKCILLTLNGAMGRAVFEASLRSTVDEGILLSQAAGIIRKHLFTKNESFDGDLSFENQRSSVPVHLLHLLGLILEGCKQYDNVSNSTEDTVIKLAQLIKFNAVKGPRRKNASEKKRHSKQNEPPLPLLMGLSIHSSTRKKGVIEFLSSQGLSVSYDRVIEIEDDITKQLCLQYKSQGIVCPPTLKKGLFTVAAIDNIDHDPSSSTSQGSFHGTSISVFQYPEVDDELPKFELDVSSPASEVSIRLPNTYTCIMPLTDSKPEPPEREERPVDPYFAHEQKGVEEWILKLKQLNLGDSGGNDRERVSFSSFFSNRSLNEMPRTSSTLLPLLEESINSAAMVRHCMNLLVNLTNHLNSGQVTVLTADQPVYALGKQVQWRFPEMYKNTVWMLGPLHIEMAFLSAVGDWLEGSGWVEALEKSNISTIGRIESFLSGKKVKRTRYAHQISLTALIKLAEEAFQEQEEFKDFESWKDAKTKENANLCFWFHTIELETLLFSFIKSLRDADFRLFVQCIDNIMPWMFALDHFHYARWMSVFLADLQKIPSQYPSIFEEFQRGYFTVKNGNRKFSNIGVDQGHEQNNKLIKIEGGAIGIFDNAKALLRWAVAGPIITQICRDAEDEDSNEKKHHEDNDSFKAKFRRDVQSLYSAFIEFGNPFSEEQLQLVQLSSRVVLDKATSDSVFEAKDIGANQFKAFKQDRLCSKDSSLYDIIHKNNLHLFRSKNTLVTSKSKHKIVSLKSDCRLYSNLFIACQSREGDLDSFFAHENHAYPISISEYGRLRKCNSKSDFLKCLDSFGTPADEPPTVQMKVVDGAAFVMMNPPPGASTFGIYCNELKEKVKAIGNRVERLDMVFDIYKSNSLKSQTRENRGTGTRVSVRENTPMLKNFNSFMRNDLNKTELFVMLAQSFASISNPVIVATNLEKVSTNNPSLSRQQLVPCNHEEADTRLLLHVFDGATHGYKKISIITVDTDVVVISLYHFFSMDLEELWIEFGTGRNKRYYPIHQLAKELTEEICRALPFWFALTGCDTVSMFAGKGKKSAWNAWESFPEVTQVFVSLSDSTNLTNEDFDTIQRFVVMLYDRTSSTSEVNQCRRMLFTKKQRPVESLPPTENCLRQHVLRAMLQSRIWCKSINKTIPDFDVNEWGWKKEEESIVPLWMTQPEASQACKELIKCGCKIKCSTRCKCKKADLSCTELCNCGGC